MTTNSPIVRRARRSAARVATLIALLASSVLLLAPAASAQDADDLQVALSVTPTNRTEPGGEFVFLVAVQNNSGESLVIESMSDNEGSLDRADSSCDAVIGDTIADGATRSCIFSDTITGDAGDSFTRTVTVVGDPAEGDDVTGSDSVTVNIVDDDDDDDDGDAGIEVEYAVSPSSRPEPGGTFNFGVRVTNTGDEDAELITLRDSVFGNLDGRGNCDTGVELEPDERYTCSFSANFTGDDGDSRTHTLTATLEDDDGDEATDTDSVQIRITDDQTVVDGGGGGTTIVVNNSSSSSSSAAAAASGGSSDPKPTPTVTITTSPSPTTKPNPSPTPTTIVRTGVDSLPMGAGGMGLLVLGSLLVVYAERERRRRLYGRIGA